MGDGTSLYSAVHALYEKVLPMIQGRKVIILMTDGVDTTSRSSTFANSLAEVEKHDVTIYPVHFDSFGDHARQTKGRIDPWVLQALGNRALGTSKAENNRGSMYLSDLAATSGGRMFSSENIGAGIPSLTTELASRYYATITVPRNGLSSRQIRVRVNHPSLAVFARSSFIED
jgi:hypothetical protein